MTPGLLLDTHILLWWIAGPHKLSKEQRRLAEQADQRQEPLSISAITLIELAYLSQSKDQRLGRQVDRVIEEVQSSETLRILPVTVDISREVVPLIPILRDPSDCVIVATARVHGLRLLTSDERILEAKLAQLVG